MAYFYKLANKYKEHPVAGYVSSMQAMNNLVAEVVTDGSVSKVLRFEIGSQQFYVKYYLQGSKFPKKYYFRSRVKTEWRNLQMFAKLGIPAPSVVAFGEETILGMYRRGFIVTEALHSTSTLHCVAIKRLDLIHNAKWMGMVIETVAEYTRLIHQHSFVHVDLKWRNILVTQADKPQVYFIDCASGHKVRFKWLLQRGLVKDLACLDKVAKQYLTRSQRLRFFMRYKQITNLCINEKSMIRKIVNFF